jgi:hypothetical protein
VLVSDEAQARIAELKDRSDRETADFDVKMRDLQTQIATDKRNKDFLQLMQVRAFDPLSVAIPFLCVLFFLRVRCANVCATRASHRSRRRKNPAAAAEAQSWTKRACRHRYTIRWCLVIARKHLLASDIAVIESMSLTSFSLWSLFVDFRRACSVLRGGVREDQDSHRNLRSRRVRYAVYPCRGPELLSVQLRQ